MYPTIQLASKLESKLESKLASKLAISGRDLTCSRIGLPACFYFLLCNRGRRITRIRRITSSLNTTRRIRDRKKTHSEIEKKTTNSDLSKKNEIECWTPLCRGPVSGGELLYKNHIVTAVK